MGVLLKLLTKALLEIGQYNKLDINLKFVHKKHIIQATDHVLSPEWKKTRVL